MKKSIILVLIAAMIISLVSCSSGGITIDDADKAAFALVTSLEFDEALSETQNDEQTLRKFRLTDSDAVLNVSRYVGSGATADEVAVFECSSADATAEVIEAINDRISYLRDGYSSYGPEEVPKIDKAKVLTYGNFVVFCISNSPEKTEEILKNL